MSREPYEPPELHIDALPAHVAVHTKRLMLERDTYKQMWQDLEEHAASSTDLSKAMRQVADDHGLLPS